MKRAHGRVVLGLVLVGFWWLPSAAISGEPVKQSVIDVLGTRKGQLGFEAKPLLGLTTAEVRTTYAADPKQEQLLDLR